MKTRYTIRIITSAVAFALLACASTKSYTIDSARTLSISAVRPALDADLAMLVPAGLQQASWLNVQQMRKSPLWPTVEVLLETHMTDVLPKSIYKDLMKSTSEILIASGHRRTNEPDGFIALFKGDFQSEDLLSQLKRQLKLRTVPDALFETLKVANIRVFAPTLHTIIIATDELATDSMALTQQQGDSLRTDDYFSSFVMPSFGGVATLYERGTSKLNFNNFGGTPLTQFRWLPSVDRFQGNLELTNTLTLTGKAVMDEPKQASAAKNDIQAQIRAITSNALIALMGVKPLINKLKLAAYDDKVDVNWSLSEADVKKVVKMIEPLMQIRQMLNAE